MAPRPSTPLVRLAAAAGLACTALAAAASPARAAPGGDIPLDGFRPAVDSRGFVTVDGADVLARGQPSFGLVTTWARGLLALDGDGAHYAVDDVISPTLVGAVGLGARLELGLSLPFGVVAGDRAPDGGAAAIGDAITAQGLGDLGLHAKLRLDRADEVVRPHRDAPGGDEHVRPEPALER